MVEGINSKYSMSPQKMENTTVDNSKNYEIFNGYGCNGANEVKVEKPLKAYQVDYTSFKKKGRIVIPRIARLPPDANQPLDKQDTHQMRYLTTM